MREMRKKTYSKILRHPLFWAVLTIAVLHIINLSAFNFLAEKDSYCWISSYQKALDNSSVNGYRQLFSSLIISLHYLTGISIYGIFKYIFPLFSLLSLFPLWLLARNLNNKIFQFLVLLFSIASPTIILQSEATRPQVMAMFFLYFLAGFFALSLGKDRKKADLSFLAIGLVSIVGALFHRIFVIFFFIWFLTVIYKYGKLIWVNKAKAVILLFILYPWTEKFEMRKMLGKIFEYSTSILNKIFINFETNFKFPAYYINIDEKQMGWVNAEGVAKYYAFYAGPFVLLVIILFSYFLFASKEFRVYLKNIFKNPVAIYVYLLLLFFFFLAEIFPRIGNIAFLPERSWIFLGILLAVPLFQLLKYFEENEARLLQGITFFALLLSLLISIGGAAYVNNQFQYIASPKKIESFHWMKKNLNKDSIMYAYGYNSLLKSHSGIKNVISIKREYLENGDMENMMKIARTKEAYNEYADVNEKLTKLKKQLTSLRSSLKSSSSISDSLLYDLETASGEITLSLNKIKRNEGVFAGKNNQSRESYFYYSKENKNNPYKERPYETDYSSNNLNEGLLILEEYPQYFKKIYDTGEVKIWKFLGNN